MKILEINKFYYRRGGADHHFLDLCELLKREGEDVAVFSMQDRRNEKSEYSKYFVSNMELGQNNLRALAHSYRIIYSAEAEKKMSKLVADFKPDIAHLHLIYHHLTPSVLVALKKAKIPTVMTIHDWKLLCPNYLLLTGGRPCERCKGGKYYQCALHRCIGGSVAKSMLVTIEAYVHHAKKYYENFIDCLIAPSNFVKNKFIEFGWPEKKIVVLPHFLPENNRQPVEPAPLPQTKKFAYFGRLSNEKGIGRLIEYWLDKDIGYQLDVYGDGPLFNALKSAAQKNKRITFHGNVRREEVFSGLKDTTAVIVPSLCYETFGLTMLESLSLGLPVVATKMGGLEEMGKKSGATLFFDWTEGSLEQALEASDDLRLRQKALGFVRGNFSGGEYYQKLMAIFSGYISA